MPPSRLAARRGRARWCGHLAGTMQVARRQRRGGLLVKTRTAMPPTRCRSTTRSRLLGRHPVIEDGACRGEARLAPLLVDEHVGTTEAVAEADLLDHVHPLRDPPGREGRVQVRLQGGRAPLLAADGPFANDDGEPLGWRLAHGAAPTNFAGAVSPRARCRCARSPGEVRGSAETNSKSSPIPGAAQLQQRLGSGPAPSDHPSKAGLLRYMVRKSRNAGTPTSEAPVAGEGLRRFCVAADEDVSGRRRCLTSSALPDVRSVPGPRPPWPGAPPAAPGAHRRSRRAGAARPPACRRRSRHDDRPAPRPPSGRRAAGAPRGVKTSSSLGDTSLPGCRPSSSITKDLQLGEALVGIGDTSDQRRHHRRGLRARPPARSPPRRRSPPRTTSPGSAPASCARPCPTSKAPSSPLAVANRMLPPVSVARPRRSASWFAQRSAPRAGVEGEEEAVVVDDRERRHGSGPDPRRRSPARGCGCDRSPSSRPARAGTCRTSTRGRTNAGSRARR